METNQRATELNTVTWWEVQTQREGRWFTVSDHNTERQAEHVRLPGQRVVKRRGLAL